MSKLKYFDNLLLVTEKGNKEMINKARLICLQFLLLMGAETFCKVIYFEAKLHPADSTFNFDDIHITFNESNTDTQKTSSYSLVFVYLGKQLPDYIKYSIFQARLFNKKCHIFFIANSEAIRNDVALINKLKEYQVIITPCENLTPTTAHKEFDLICKRRAIGNYTRFTTERFFYIEELMTKYNLNDVFQVECDVMLYINLENYLDLLHKYYKGIACPFENDYIASVSITYFSNHEIIKQFNDYIIYNQKGQYYDCDMFLLGSFKNYSTSKEVEHLPTITKDYIHRTILINARGEMPSNPWKYWNRIEEWNSIFDNDAIGTFLFTGNYKEFTRPFFDPHQYTYTWELDQENRLIPYICHTDSYQMKYRINTLHIASKKLEKFLSIGQKTIF